MATNLDANLSTATTESKAAAVYQEAIAKIERETQQAMVATQAAMNAWNNVRA